jgi:ribulose-phosphate 3-epimerase
MKKDDVKLATSLMTADFARMGEQVADVERSGADRIHVDIMDGRFVPNISGGLPVIRWLQKATQLPVEAHLMMLDPDLLLDEFVDAGASTLLVHWEGNNNLARTLRRIRLLGQRAGVAINPATPMSVLDEVLPDLDQVLILTGLPELGRQQFMHSTLAKVALARELIDEINPDCELEVEGGIDAETVPMVFDAGANVLVVGSAVFNQSEGVVASMKKLRDSLDA